MCVCDTYTQTGLAPVLSCSISVSGISVNVGENTNLAFNFQGGEGFDVAIVL